VSYERIATAGKRRLAKTRGGLAAHKKCELSKMHGWLNLRELGIFGSKYMSGSQKT